MEADRMRRILLIARRDYLQTVLSKAYLFGLILLPLIFGGGFLAIAIANRGSAKEQRIAIVDRTGVSAAAVTQACEESTRKTNSGAAGGMRVTPHYVFEEIAPESDDAAQLLSLAGRIRRGELFLVLDISADALNPPPGATQVIRYYSNATAVNQLALWLPAATNDGLRRVRLAQLGMDAARVDGALRDVSVVSMNLPSKDPATGKIVLGETRSPLQTVAMPVFLVVLMVMVVMVGSAPGLSVVAEDKAQRVFEMLLVSASPFELMMGKVLATLAASLTSSTFYIVGGLFALLGMAMFGLAPLNLLPWFFAYLIVEVLMTAALSIALGSACASAQDAQQLAFLLFVPIFVPILMVTPVMQQPGGVFATTMSFIPPFTPVLMLLRQALPGGVPWWQPWLGLAGAIVYALATIWAAARIFRIGILSQGKTPKVAELAQWVLWG
jgi:ABC-2 type transport system permease protein